VKLFLRGDEGTLTERKGDNMYRSIERNYQMKTKKVLLIMLALLVIVSLTSCAMFNRGTMNYSRATTIGQELLDLKEAKDDGLITEEEYGKLKQEIMEGGPVQIKIESKD